MAGLSLRSQSLPPPLAAHAMLCHAPPPALRTRSREYLERSSLAVNVPASSNHRKLPLNLVYSSSILSNSILPQFSPLPSSSLSFLALPYTTLTTYHIVHLSFQTRSYSTSPADKSLSSHSSHSTPSPTSSLFSFNSVDQLSLPPSRVPCRPSFFFFSPPRFKSCTISRVLSLSQTNMPPLSIHHAVSHPTSLNCAVRTAITFQDHSSLFLF